MKNGRLRIKYRSSLSSVILMDTFERRNENGAIQNDYLIIDDLFKFECGGKVFFADVLILRKPYEMPWGGIGITFTYIKKNVAGKKFSFSSAFMPEPVKQLVCTLSEMECVCDEWIDIEPVILKAQTSGNRAGFGTPRRGGRLFGDTNPYIITKIFLHENESGTLPL